MLLLKIDVIGRRHTAAEQNLEVGGAQAEAVPTAEGTRPHLRFVWQIAAGEAKGRAASATAERSKAAAEAGGATH